MARAGFEPSLAKQVGQLVDFDHGGVSQSSIGSHISARMSEANRGARHPDYEAWLPILEVVLLKRERIQDVDTEALEHKRMAMVGFWEHSNPNIGLTARPSAADCGSSSTPTVQILNSPADATALGNQCLIVWGDVAIGPDASGTLNLAGINNITGNLYLLNNDSDVLDSQVISIQSPTLLQINGAVDIRNQTMLESLIVPNLESVGGSLLFAWLPNLQSLDFSSLRLGGANVEIYMTPELTSVSIPAGLSSPSTFGWTVWGSGVRSIDGFASSDGTVNVVFNPYLTYVELQISSASAGVFANGTQRPNTGYVQIQYNAPEANISLPNLATTEGDVNLGNCSELSIPSLSDVGGSLNILNASFTRFSAPSLSTINGSLTITGSFTGISSFPALSRIAGNVHVSSSQPLDCAALQYLSSASKIGGSFFCAGAAIPQHSGVASTTATTSTTSPSPSSPSSSRPTSGPSNGLSAAAKGGIGAGASVVGLLLIVVIYFFMRQRKREASAHSTADVAPREKSTAPKELEPAPLQIPSVERQELEASPLDSREELEASPNEVHELRGDERIMLQGDAR